jgi:hypothetical protein
MGLNTLSPYLPRLQGRAESKDSQACTSASFMMSDEYVFPCLSCLSISAPLLEHPSSTSPVVDEVEGQ